MLALGADSFHLLLTPQPAAARTEGDWREKNVLNEFFNCGLSHTFAKVFGITPWRNLPSQWPGESPLNLHGHAAHVHKTEQSVGVTWCWMDGGSLLICRLGSCQTTLVLHFSTSASRYWRSTWNSGRAASCHNIARPPLLAKQLAGLGPRCCYSN